MQNLAFFIKAFFGFYIRKTPLRPWTSFEPKGNGFAEYPAHWRTKAPALPIAQISREYLAPWLENYAMESGHSPVDEAKAIALGKYRLNSSRFLSADFPPSWNHGLESIVSQHWSKISSESKTMREMTYELSRFSWALVLVRAWILDGDSSHVENFWKLFEDWVDKNQPHLGPQWVSDEEVARRLLVITFIAQAFRHHPATTDARILKVARFVSVSAERLQATLPESGKTSAKAGLLVAVGLYTAGALWPRFPLSDIWRSDGLEWTLDNYLGRALESYSLSTPDERRELLQLITWLEITLRAEKETLPEVLHQEIYRLLYSMSKQDETLHFTSNLFPLAGCPVDEMKPILVAAQALFQGVRPPNSSADESSLLLCGPVCASSF